MQVVGLTGVARWLNRGQAVVLCYHGVTAQESRNHFDRAGLHVRASLFEAQLDYLRRHYNVLPLSAFLAARQKGHSMPPRTAVITFDDGYRNILSEAVPRLWNRGLTAAVLLITGRIANAGPNEAPTAQADDRLYLSWPDVRAMHRGGIEIGSHTCTHRRLPQLSHDEAERELTESLATIRREVGIESPPFAYPYGAYTHKVAERARAAGYCCALTTDVGMNASDTDLFSIRRVLIGDDDEVPVFAARVAGLAGPLARARRSLQAARDTIASRIRSRNRRTQPSGV